MSWTKTWESDNIWTLNRCSLKNGYSTVWFDFIISVDKPINENKSGSGGLGSHNKYSHNKYTHNKNS